MSQEAERPEGCQTQYKYISGHGHMCPSAVEEKSERKIVCHTERLITQFIFPFWWEKSRKMKKKKAAGCMLT